MNNDTTTQVIHTREETEFMMATQAWMAKTGRVYPTWSEKLAEIKNLQDKPINEDDASATEFRLATEAWMQKSGRKFPAWSETLKILKSLGYEKELPVQGPVNC